MDPMFHCTFDVSLILANEARAEETMMAGYDVVEKVDDEEGIVRQSMTEVVNRAQVGGNQEFQLVVLGLVPQVLRAMVVGLPVAGSMVWTAGR
jgi:hypothetical protein